MPPKKKGKKDKEEGSGGLGSGGVKAEEEEKRSIEYYQLKMQDMNEKMERMRLKVDTLTKENTTLAKAQSKFYSDKQDIVEFLNIKVGEHEKMITSLESRNKVLEDEKKSHEERFKAQLEFLHKNSQQEIENLTFQCQKLKTDLVELSSFSAQRDEMSQQLKQTKTFLEKKEAEYRETIHGLERKVLQDKSQMKREMLQKVNEAVANFRKVADQQMAETTKRAIRENMSISSQLKKMSQKTTEFIGENDHLKDTIAKLKRQNALLAESEKELAKKSNANQKVIKMLVDKLKESDQMLELAFEENDFNSKMELPAYNPFAPPPEDDYGGVGNGGLTDEMVEEIQILQDDYNELVERMTSVNGLGQDLQFLLEEAENAIKNSNEAIVLDYIHTNLGAVIQKLADLTTFEEEDLQDSAPSGDSEMNEAYREGDYDELDESQIQEEQEGQDDGLIQEFDEEEEFPMTASCENILEESAEYIDDPQEYGSSRQDTQPSSAQSSRANYGTAPADRNSRRRSTQKPIQNKYQDKIQKNFLSMIGSKSNPNKYSIPSIDGDSAVVHHRGRKMRHTGVQTTSIPFGPSVDTKYLLGELRPWGNRAQFLPQKGLGLYYSRNPTHLANAAKLDEKLAIKEELLEASKLGAGRSIQELTPIMVTNGTSKI